MIRPYTGTIESTLALTPKGTGAYLDPVSLRIGCNVVNEEARPEYDRELVVVWEACLACQETSIGIEQCTNQREDA